MRRLMSYVAVLLGSLLGGFVGVYGLFTDDNPRGLHPGRDDLTMEILIGVLLVSAIVSIVSLWYVERVEDDGLETSIPVPLSLAFGIGLGVGTILPFAGFIALLLVLLGLAILETMLSLSFWKWAIPVLLVVFLPETMKKLKR